MVTRPRLPIRDVARRAVQAELVAAAQELFDERGYEATTIDAIAAVAGMSRRSFFRYFESKDELVLGKYDLLGERLLAGFRSRPDDEPLWSALRAMFEGVAAGGDPEVPVHAIERIVDESPALRAGYLYRLDAMQRAIAAAERERAARRGAPYDPDDPAPEALVGAAFAAVIAARTTAPRSDQPWSALVDRAMQAVRP